MLLNECVLVCTNTDGAKRVWLYDIDSTVAKGQLRVRVWPQDEVTPEDGGAHFQLHVSAVDEQSSRIEYIPTERSERIGDWERSVVAIALYTVLARRLNKRLLSTGVTPAWRYLASINEADEIEPGRFVIEGRSGLARPTQFGPLPERPAPTCEAEFESLMIEVDRRLQEQQIAIPGRQLVARAEISKILASQLSSVGTKGLSPGARYEGDDLVIRVDEWISNRYGERLLVDFSRGRAAVLLRGAVWFFKLPWLVGQWRLIASQTVPSDKPELSAYRGDQPPPPKPPPVHNVVESLVDLPDGLKQDLTDAELRHLLFVFETGLSCFDGLRAVQQSPYIREAIADHLAAVDHLSGPVSTAHPGLSKWASQQAVEKTYKALLTARGTPFPPTHVIKKLSKLAVQAGLQPADPDLIAEVECKPSVRYGETKVTVDEAISAHHAALDLSWYIAGEIKGAPVSPPQT